MLTLQLFSLCAHCLGACHELKSQIKGIHVTQDLCVVLWQSPTEKNKIEKVETILSQLTQDSIQEDH